MNFLGSLVVAFLVLFSFIYGVRYFSGEPISSAPIVRFDESNVAEFVTNRQPKPDVGPYIVRAEIIGELNYQLDLEFDYVVAPDDPVQYIMSVSAGGGDDIKMRKIYLDPSTSKLRVSLVFEPETKFMARFSSSYIFIEITAFLSKTERVDVYKRRLAYRKTWIKKREPIGSFLNPSTFQTRAIE